MSTGPTKRLDNSPAGHSGGRQGRRWLRDTRIRSKLALILVIPLAAVLFLGTVRLIEVGHQATQAGQVRALSSLSIDVSAVVEEVHRERMAAVTRLVNPTSTADAFNTQAAQTDVRIVRYNNQRRALVDLPPALDERLRAVDSGLAELAALRQQVRDGRAVPAAEAEQRYGDIMTTLVSYGEVLGQVSGDGPVADGLRAMADFSRAAAATSQEQAAAVVALSAGTLDPDRYLALVTAASGRQQALQAFALIADPRQRAVVDGTVTGDPIARADRIAAELGRSIGQRPAVTPDDADDAVGAVHDLMRQAQVQLEAGLLAQAEQARADASQRVIRDLVLVLLTLVGAIAVAAVLARSLDYALRRLREGALAVANHELPLSVRRLRDAADVDESSVEDIVRQVQDPIRLTGRDEVGQVAQAFNVVHREAVRVAAEQAALRTSVSAMFLNLARRSQALVDRMIGELDMIERGEEDPKRLAQLFELDHLATRMRRNDENLLVLAGADSTPPRRDDALLVDALRAAQSEVELYNRIEFGTIDTDISVSAHAVNDVVRLVAELLDNATRFSPPNTAVVADARQVRDHVLIQIEDRGLGLTDEQLDGLNRRLAAPPTVDVAAFRLMGLAVVSRLAARYGISVRLRRNVDGGTVAEVTLPANTVVLPPGRGREHVLGRKQLAVESGPTAGSPAGALPESVPPVGGRLAAATLSGPPRPAWSTSLEPPQPARLIDENEPVGVGAGVPHGEHQVTTAPAPGGRSAGFADTTGTDSGRPPLPKRVPGGGGLNPGTVHSPAAAPALPAGPLAGSGAAAPGWPPYGADRRGSDGRAAGSTLPSAFNRWSTAPVAPLASPGGTDEPMEPPAAPMPMEAAAPTLVEPAARIEAPAPVDPATQVEPPAPVQRYGSFRPIGSRETRSANESPAAAPGEQQPAAWSADQPLAAWSAEQPSAAWSADQPLAAWSGEQPPASLADQPRVAWSSGQPPATAALWPAVPEAEPVAPNVAARSVEPVSAPPVPPPWTPPASGPTRAGSPPPASSDLAVQQQPAGAGKPRDSRELPIFREMEAVWFRSHGQDATQIFTMPPVEDGRPGATPAPRPSGTAPVVRGTARVAEAWPPRDEAGRPALPTRTPTPPADPSVEAGPAKAAAPPAWAPEPPAPFAPPVVPQPVAAADEPVASAVAEPAGVPAQPAPGGGQSWRTAADEGWARATQAAEPAAGGTTRSGLPKRVPQAQLVPGGVEARSPERTKRTPDQVRGLLSAYHRGVQRGRSAGTGTTGISSAKETSE